VRTPVFAARLGCPRTRSSRGRIPDAAVHSTCSYVDVIRPAPSAGFRCRARRSWDRSTNRAPRCPRTSRRRSKAILPSTTSWRAGVGIRNPRLISLYPSWTPCSNSFAAETGRKRAISAPGGHCFDPWRVPKARTINLREPRGYTENLQLRLPHGLHPSNLRRTRSDEGVRLLAGLTQLTSPRYLRGTRNRGRWGGRALGRRWTGLTSLALLAQPHSGARGRAPCRWPRLSSV